MKRAKAFGERVPWAIRILGVAMVLSVASARENDDVTDLPPRLAGQEVPAEFVHGRVFVTPETADGQILRFFTDTGGGFNAVTESIAETLGTEIQDNGSGERTIAFPVFHKDARIPRPVAEPGLNGRLILADVGRYGDGFLGGRWFGDKVWEFDYQAETLRLLDHSVRPTDPVESANSISLGFQENSEGRRTLHFPRMSITIAGEQHEMLLDTGATANLTADAARVFGVDVATQVATSFVVERIFDQWRTRHPDWPIIEHGDSIRGVERPMIQVPAVTIAGVESGPVWFSSRPDTAFDDYMAQFMDEPIVGAVGGSAFVHYRIIIDYPESTAWFERSRP